MADTDKLEYQVAPVMQREFLEKLLAAFPPYRVKVEDTIEKVQREAGKQDVIEWIRRNVGLGR